MPAFPCVLQKKKRTHLPDAEDPAKKGQPKSFVFRRGRHGAILRDLERDLRKVRPALPPARFCHGVSHLVAGCCRSAAALHMPSLPCPPPAPSGVAMVERATGAVQCAPPSPHPPLPACHAQLMAPNTATSLKESKRNQIKDFLHVAGPLGVTHFMILTATHNASYLRIAK